MIKCLRKEKIMRENVSSVQLWQVVSHKLWDLLSMSVKENINLFNDPATTSLQVEKSNIVRWQLAHQNLRDLLATIPTESDANLTGLNLNVTPPEENHPDKSVTLAWSLAFHERWGLLENLSGKKGVTPVDLNAGPLAEDQITKGVTLASLLAFHEKWDLLKTLSIKEGVTPADLNAAPLAEANPNKGITLALELAYDEKWGVLEALAVTKGSCLIYLNAAALAEVHPYKGATLAWLLAVD